MEDGMKVMNPEPISAPSPVLEDLDRAVVRIYTLVREALEGATEIFLAADRKAARKLVERDQVIDDLHRQAEEMVMEELLQPGLSDRFGPGERHHLLLILRILPELERSGDLAEHIASHAAQDLAQWLSPRARKLVAQMGAVGTEMWTLAAEAFASGDGSVADLLRERDDEIDDLHVSLTAELAAARVSIPVAIEMALVARYFERLGDHAVNVTRRVQAMNRALEHHHDRRTGM
jgi:phosphate transport system protein